MPSSIIDSHIHPIEKLVQPADIINEMNKSGIAKAVLLAMDLDASILETKKFHQSLNQTLSYSFIFNVDEIIRGMRFILDYADTANQQVATIVQKYPDRFIGFGSVHVGHKSKKYIKMKLNEIHSLGLKGIKILPTLQFFNPSSSKNLPLIFKFAEKFDLPLLYHTGCDPGPWELPALSKNGNPLLLEPLIKRYHKTKVILAHLGSYSSHNPGIWLNEALYLLKLYPNTWGDLAAVPYLMTEQQFITAIKKVDPNLQRVMFGSDYPIAGVGANLGIEPSLQHIQNSDYLDDDEKENIFYYNAKSLLFS